MSVTNREFCSDFKSEVIIQKKCTGKKEGPTTFLEGFGIFFGEKTVSQDNLFSVQFSEMSLQILNQHGILDILTPILTYF
jgi:hypothetical protein